MISEPVGQTHPPQLVVSEGAGIHECLSDDGQNSIHMIGGLHIKDELWILQDVDPESKWQTV